MINTITQYCKSLTEYKRYKTREVFVGKIPLGGSNPIRIQSMTTTDTMDTLATVEQSIKMINAGCEYVRVTAPSIKEANNLQNIKDELRRRGYDNPLIADIHFTPNAAEAAAEIVEKVRINPGNYIDKKKFQQIEYTNEQYNAEIERIRERFSPLVKICKTHGTAMRIGTNHGSLSDRIMSRYGDTPLGMVESALEFVRICEELDFHNIVLSMKSSNTRVMVQAYRLLINKMEAEGMNYPLHLGVTEAGDGEDGRIKSAVGIGALLNDGIGDTIRVSLTEPPENEIPVAIAITKAINKTQNNYEQNVISKLPYNPFEYQRRKSTAVSSIGGSEVIKVVADLSASNKIGYEQLAEIGANYLPDLDKWNFSDQTPDFIFIGDNELEIEIPNNIGVIVNYQNWQNLKSENNIFPLLKFEQLTNEVELNAEMIFAEVNAGDSQNFFENLPNIKNKENIILVLTSGVQQNSRMQRNFFIELMNRKLLSPIIIKNQYSIDYVDKFRISASIDFGNLLIDGFGDGVWIETNSTNKLRGINRNLFGILQASRVRISKTEYIACPSCGRTLFDLVEVTNNIRKLTEHLKGVKIGIMGCIVNGPGEMADADYGYVGSGPGKITLYRSKEIVRKNIPSKSAVDELIGIIKEDGNWVDKSE